MAITLRSRREIELMRKAGAVVADVLSKLQEYAKPGVTTGWLDKMASQMAADAGAQPLFKGVCSPYARTPFPGVICASINNEVVHGIPSDSLVLKQGDILSIDFGVKIEGYCADAAVTMGIGEITDNKLRLIEVTKHVLDIAVEKSAPGVKWSQVAAEMQNYAESAGFSVVKDFVGHGIGKQMHEETKVPNFVSRQFAARDFVLRAGLVIAVEPMVAMGTHDVMVLSDGWTVVTADGLPAAHFEHTLAITDSGVRILTDGT